MNNIQTATPIKPADLDNTKLHTPAEYKAWQQSMRDYYNALRAIEQAAERKAQAVIAEQNRPISDDEYHALAVKRKQIADDKIAERAAAEKSAALAEIEKLMSSPATVDVINRNEVLFMVEVIQWANRGYTMPETGFHSFGLGLFHITMNAPVLAKKVGAK
nr:hypothetical protein [uncultured Albidiferax sp.]